MQVKDEEQSLGLLYRSKRYMPIKIVFSDLTIWDYSLASKIYLWGQWDRTINPYKKCLRNSDLVSSLQSHHLCSHGGFPVIKWSIEFPRLPNPLQETHSVKVMELQGAANFRVCLPPRGSSVSQIMDSGNLRAGRVHWDCGIQAPHFPDEEWAWPAKTTLLVGGERGLGFAAQSSTGLPVTVEELGETQWKRLPSGWQTVHTSKWPGRDHPGTGANECVTFRWKVCGIIIRKASRELWGVRRRLRRLIQEFPYGKGPSTSPHYFPVSGQSRGEVLITVNVSGSNELFVR